MGCGSIRWGCRYGRSPRWSGWIDVDRSHGAVWNWTHKLSESQNDPATAEPSRVAVDEKRIELHDSDDIEFLVDGMAPLLNIV